MTIEKINIKELFASLDNTTSELLQLISSFSEKQINTIPFENNWTAAQVAEHITKSNEGMIRSLKTEGKPAGREPDEKVQGLKDVFLNFASKLQSPKFILPTQDIYQKETVIDDLRKSIEQLKEISGIINLPDAIAHPIFGDITKLEILHFVLYHTQRHIRQLKNIFQIVATAS